MDNNDNNAGKIVALKKQISILTNEKKKKNITPQEYQLINDRIKDIKNEIDNYSRKNEPTIVPVTNARTISERKGF